MAKCWTFFGIYSILLGTFSLLHMGKYGKLIQQSGHTASIHQIQILAKLDGGWKDFFVENFKFAFGWGKRERLNYSDDATFAKMNKFNFFHKTRTDFGHFFNILYLGGIIQNEQIQFFHKTRTDFGHFYKILWVV